MRNGLFLLFILLLVRTGESSAQTLQWQTLIGGGLPDRAWSITEAADHEIVIAGQTLSTDGDISKNAGGADAFIAKVRADGQLRWLYTYGGTGLDYAGKIISTSDGGFIMVGFSESSTGTFSSNHGKKDAYVVKLDGEGQLEWQKLFGGSLEEGFSDVIETTAGDFVLVGYNQSDDGDVVGHIESEGSFATTDGWILKLNSTGDIIWQRSLGGRQSDVFSKLAATDDGGYIVLGQSLSSTVDVGNNYGKSDIWLVKLSEEASIEWEINLGGSGGEHEYDLLPVENGYLVLGDSESSDQDLSSNRGKFDSALFSVDKAGALQWVQSYGGLRNDYLKQITRYGKDQYLLSGNTLSQLYLELPRFAGSSWLMVVDEFGKKISESLTDSGKSGNYFDVHRNQDGSFIFTGTTDSPIENLNKGGLDIWLGRFLSDFNHIDGTIYVDFDDNGVQDTEDAPVNHVAITTRKTDFGLTTHASEGQFDFYLQNGTYTTRVEDLSPYFELVPDSIISDFSEINALENVEFRLLPTGSLPEVTLNLIPLGPARPGFVASYRLIISNNGNKTLSGEATVAFDLEKISFINASESNLSQVENELKFAFANLKPFGQASVYTRFKVATIPTVSLLDVLLFESSIPVYSGELIPEDNIDLLYHDITAAYDPNDKTLLSASTISPGELSEKYIADYLVRFQNTGTDTAFNIVIHDTLTSNHLVPSLKILASSHPYRTEVKNDSILHIHFDDILLVDSLENEPESHGFFSYQIELDSWVPVDSLIRNTAHIYFDYNPPITTNTTMLEIREPIINSIRRAESLIKRLNIYPNPTEDVLNIEVELAKASKLKLTVTDSMGKVIYSKVYPPAVGKQRLRVNCNDFASGNYFLSMVTKEGREGISFSKLK